MSNFRDLTWRNFCTSAERLVKLIEMAAPPQIIAKEVALIFSRGSILYPELWAQVQSKFADSLHAINGACKVCGEIKESVVSGLCKDCEIDPHEDDDDFNPEHN